MQFPTADEAIAAFSIQYKLHMSVSETKNFVEENTMSSTSFSFRGFMACFKWLEEELKKQQGINTPGVLQNAKTNPLDTQVGGSHYTELKIQPIEYSMANNLNACQHTAIKYVTRYKQKGGVADLDKAIHTIELLKHFESQK